MKNKKEKIIFKDKHYHAYTPQFSVFDTSIAVVCPKCGEIAIITGDEESLFVYFHCSSCGKKEEKSLYKKKYDVHNWCENCGRYYRVYVEETHRQKINVGCPYCKHKQIGSVQTHQERFWTIGEVKDAIEPFFSYALYYKGSFKNKIIWAINKEHLNYLIDYISADLRIKNKYAYDNSYGERSASDHIPTFMKNAKNREAIIKVLEKMRAL